MSKEKIIISGGGDCVMGFIFLIMMLIFSHFLGSGPHGASLTEILLMAILWVLYAIAQVISERKDK